MFDIVPESSTPSRPAVDPRRLAAAVALRRLPGRNWTKADVLLYRLDGTDVAVKDYSSRPCVVRNTIGRLMTRREAAAYRAAEGVPGIPECYGRVGPFALALRWIEARTLADMRGELLDDSFFDRVAVILDRLHGRGIALGDLHHRDILVDAEGSAHVVDLATALVLGERPGRLRRAAFERLRDQDRVALARLRARWTGRDEAEAIAGVGAAAAAWHARYRALRRIWDRLRGRSVGRSR
jgi:hypothetical protein